MTTQDETSFNNGQNQAQAAVAVQNEKSTNSRSASRWQTVTIGGVAGIAMGMAASQAYDSLTTDDDAVEIIEDGQEGATTDTSTDATVTEVHQATVDQNLSFGDAFAAARAEVGAGGVFLWHGQLYNTFTAEEWQSMSDAQRDEFADDVQPYLGQQTAQVHHTTTHTTSHVETVHTEDVAAEPEVHFLGVESREVNGQIINIGHMTYDNTAVALVDVDNDKVFDVSLIDVNRNDKVEDDEVTDISDRGITVEDFQYASEMNQMQDGYENIEQTGQQQQESVLDCSDGVIEMDTVLL